jgi:hypothetical protein
MMLQLERFIVEDGSMGHRVNGSEAMGIAVSELALAGRESAVRAFCQLDNGPAALDLIHV